MQNLPCSNFKPVKSYIQYSSCIRKIAIGHRTIFSCSSIKFKMQFTISDIKRSHMKSPGNVAHSTPLNRELLLVYSGQGKKFQRLAVDLQFCINTYARAHIRCPVASEARRKRK